jgi:hypothetical protein
MITLNTAHVFNGVTMIICNRCARGVLRTDWPAEDLNQLTLADLSGLIDEHIRNYHPEEMQEPSQVARTWSDYSPILDEED